jgi:hypothetical protein
MATDALPRLAFRHWYITLAGLVVTVLLCGVAYKAFPVTYQAKADVLVLPAQKSVGTGGNPYLELGGIQQAAEVLVSAMSDSTATDAVQAKGGLGGYSVAIDPRTSAPLLLITGNGKSPASALTTLQAVISIADPTLLRLQQAINVPSGYLITTKVVTVDGTATAVRKSQIRGIIAAGAAGIALTLLMVALLSRLIERRRARRLAARSKAVPTPPARPVADVRPEPAPTTLAPSSYDIERQPTVGSQSLDPFGLATVKSATEGVLGPLRRG